MGKFNFQIVIYLILLLKVTRPPIKTLSSQNKRELFMHALCIFMTSETSQSFLASNAGNRRFLSDYLASHKKS